MKQIKKVSTIIILTLILCSSTTGISLSEHEDPGPMGGVVKNL